MSKAKGSGVELLIGEVHSNARRDRSQLEELHSNLIKMLNNYVEVEADVVSKVVDSIAKLSDCLNKTNSQLVEIAKIMARAEAPRSVPEHIDDADRDRISAEIGEDLEIN